MSFQLRPREELIAVDGCTESSHLNIPIHIPKQAKHTPGPSATPTPPCTLTRYIRSPPLRGMGSPGSRYKKPHNRRSNLIMSLYSVGTSSPWSTSTRAEITVAVCLRRQDIYNTSRGLRALTGECRASTLASMNTYYTNQSLLTDHWDTQRRQACRGRRR